MTGPQGDVQMFELRIVATGEVRDANGNLLNTPTAETTVIVTEAEALEFLERHDQR